MPAMKTVLQRFSAVTRHVRIKENFEGNETSRRLSFYKRCQDEEAEITRSGKNIQQTEPWIKSFIPLF